MARAQFSGDLVQGHFERGGEAIARGTTVTVVEIAYFKELDFAGRAPDLGYVLFGKEGELFLAHRVTQPPDFDQLLSVNVGGLPDHDVARYVKEQVFADSDRLNGLLVTLEEKENSLHHRFKPGETSAARGHITGRHSFLDLEVEALEELYFEEGELSDPPTFDPTEEEIAAGFGE